MPIKEINCKDCSWSTEILVDKTLQRKRQCRFNPPQLVMIPTIQGMMVMSDYPAVTDDMWCSRYQNS